MKIILSRKGFDSTIQGGGRPSFVYKNECFPLPIPEVNTGVKYEDLVFKDNLSYLDVMRDLKINQFTECHFDPYLSDKMLKNSKIVNWKKSLGQCDSAQGHLAKNKIEIDDIFLFFGWFNELKRVKGIFKYVPFSNHTKEGIHLIYGYLQVGDILKIDKKFKLKDWENHPHEIQKNHYRGENCIYVARDKFSENENIGGAGLFKFDENLILTEQNKSRANWELPSFFHPNYKVDISYLPNKLGKWQLENDKAKVQAYGQFQELVVLEDGNDKIKGWAKNLIIKHAQRI